MKLVLALIIYSVVISQVSLTVGVAQEVWETPQNVESPSESGGGGFFGAVADAIKAVLAPFRWVFNTVAVILMFLTYQIDGIPPLINTVTVAPLGGGILWVTVRLIRGGG